jgi:hypothetical protein
MAGPLWEGGGLGLGGGVCHTYPALDMATLLRRDPSPWDSESRVSSRAPTPESVEYDELERLRACETFAFSRAEMHRSTGYHAFCR